MTSRDEVVRVVRVFVSSPGDVQAEREVLDEVVQRINDTTDQAIRLELFKWERNVVPRIGPPAQRVVDDQTPAYGIYLGILAHRFGTATGQYGSGTEKEFRDALQRWAKLGQPWILFYFNDRPITPSELDLTQYGRVQAFRKELEARGLYATYQGVRGSADAFFEKVEQHLRLILRGCHRPGERRGGPSRRAQGARPDAGGALGLSRVASGPVRRPRVPRPPAQAWPGGAAQPRVRPADDVGGRRMSAASRGGPSA